VRNIATLGGNVAHALPAADGTIALFALQAQAEIASKEGNRRVGMDELFIGPGKSTLNPTRDLLVGFYLPLRAEGSASAFQRVMRPQGVAIAILNMALWLMRDVERIIDVHVSAGPVGPVPKRLEATEMAIRGKKMAALDFQQLGAVLLDEVSLRTSRHRATSEYRQHLAVDLLEQTLKSAWQAAQ
jgi:carbon-monoxide dehydrogenase medium subunit